MNLRPSWRCALWAIVSAHERKEWPSRRATPATSRPSVPRLARARVQTRLGSRSGALKTAPNTTWVHGGAERWEGGGLGRHGCMEGWDGQAAATGMRGDRGDRPAGEGGERGGSQRRRQDTAPPQVVHGLAAPERGERQVTGVAHVVGARGAWAASAHEADRRGWKGRKQGTAGMAGQVAAARSSSSRHCGARRGEVEEEEAYRGTLALARS